jgi:hypothetical protein
MRQPRKRRNISLAVLAVGVTYFLVTVFVAPVDPRDAAVFGSLVVACFVSLLGLVGTIAYHVTHQRLQRLLRGERILARWTVSPDEWKAFRDNERSRATAGRDNAVKVRKASEATGIDVVITEESLMVDDDFYHLITEMRELQWLPESPPCLDFRMVTTGKSSVTWHIRFPATAGAESKARVPWDHFQQRLAPRDQRSRIPNFRIARQLGAIVACVSAVALGFAWYHYGNRSMQTPVLASMIGGMLGFPLGLFVFGLTHWWLTRGPGKPIVS